MRPQSKLRSEHPDWTQQQIADEVGVTQGYVNQVISKNLESKESVMIPEHLTATDSKADFRKLPEVLHRRRDWRAGWVECQSNSRGTYNYFYRPEKTVESHLFRAGLRTTDLQRRFWFDEIRRTAWREHEEAEAKKRQACGQGGVLLKETFPEANKGQTRDKIGERVG